MLTYAEREIATVSVLAAMGGVQPMMAAHINIALNVEVTPEQLYQLLSIIEKSIGHSEADAGNAVLTKILKDKGFKYNM